MLQRNIARKEAIAMDLREAKQKLDEWYENNDVEITPELLDASYRAICKCLQEESGTVKITDSFGQEHDAILVSDTDSPYLEYEYKIQEIKYNPNYGDNRMCRCGHPYHRHFDPYMKMEVSRCKYCGCDAFVEASL